MTATKTAKDLDASEVINKQTNKQSLNTLEKGECADM